MREDNTDIDSFESLAGKRIAVQIGTTGAEQAAQVEGATVSTFDGAPWRCKNCSMAGWMRSSTTCR